MLSRILQCTCHVFKFCSHAIVLWLVYTELQIWGLICDPWDGNQIPVTLSNTITVPNQTKAAISDPTTKPPWAHSVSSDVTIGPTKRFLRHRYRDVVPRVQRENQRKDKVVRLKYSLNSFWKNRNLIKSSIQVSLHIRLERCWGRTLYERKDPKETCLVIRHLYLFCR